MDPLHVFIWLGEDKQVEEVQRIVAVLYSNATGTAKNKARSGAAPAAEKKKTEQGDDDPLWALFSQVDKSQRPSTWTSRIKKSTPQVQSVQSRLENKMCGAS